LPKCLIIPLIGPKTLNPELLINARTYIDVRILINAGTLALAPRWQIGFPNSIVSFFSLGANTRPIKLSIY
jgi:hypothetical protein